MRKNFLRQEKKLVERDLFRNLKYSLYTTVSPLFGSQNSFKNFAETRNWISWQSKEIF